MRLRQIGKDAARGREGLVVIIGMFLMRQASNYDGGVRRWLRSWLCNSAQLTGWSLLGAYDGILLKLVFDSVRYRALPLAGDWEVTEMAMILGTVLVPLPIFLGCGLFEIVARRATAITSLLLGAGFGLLAWRWAFGAIFEF